MRGAASSSRCSAARRRRGRWRRGRSRPADAGDRLPIASPGTDPEARARSQPFRQGLQGWAGPKASNVRIDYRCALTGDAARIRQYAAELVEPIRRHRRDRQHIVAAAEAGDRYGPNCLRAGRRPSRGRASSTSLARPGGNITGFTFFDRKLSGKLAGAAQGDCARSRRQLSLVNPETARHFRCTGASSAALQRLVIRSGVDGANRGRHRTSSQHLRASRTEALIVTSDPLRWSTVLRADPRLAARHALPAIYAFASHVAGGGLISYGADTQPHIVRRAASMSAAFSRARSPPICRLSSRPSSSW